jgi:hypothetical protein
MKVSNTKNQFAVAAATFCLIGLTLLLSVMIWHRQINQHPWFKRDVAGVVANDLQVAAVSSVPTVANTATAVPDSVIKEITEDPRNLRGQTIPPTAALSPALQFLYTLESPNIFPSQQ